MKNIKYILVIAVVCLVTIIGFIGAGKGTLVEVGANGTPTPTPAKNFYAATKPIPEEMVYWMLFEQINELKTKDTQSSLQGETTTFKNSFYANTLKLSATQFAAIDNAVANCLSQIQPIDQQARQIINQYRSQYPNGQLVKKQPSQPSGEFYSPRIESPIENVPPVPPQLLTLQNQKNQIILNTKESIRQALGASSFAEFDAAVKEDANNILEPLNLGSRTPEPYPSPSN